MQLSAIIVRYILIFYAMLIEKTNIKSIIVMIITVDIIYIILTPKKAIFETINIVAQMIIIYFINILYHYRIEISNDNYCIQVEMCLIMFLAIYATYFFLKNVEDTVAYRKKGKVK